MVNNEGDWKTINVRSSGREREEPYVEDGGILKGLAIDRHPLIPCEGLTSLKDVRGVTVKPTARWRAGKSVKWRFGVTDLVFEEGVDEVEERGEENHERK